MRDTEKVFLALNEYLQKHNIKTDELTKEQMDFIFQQFIREYNSNLRKPKRKTKKEQAEDYYEEALACEDINKSVQLLEKVIELNPKHFDAKVELASITNPDFLACKEIELLCKKEEAKYRKSGFYEENMGSFYGIVETRPFIRAKYRLATLYNSCGMYKKASEVCEEILLLNENDNMGARHLLMGIYALLCEYEKALALYDKYPEESVLMLLYLAGAAFTSNHLDASIEYLNRVVDVCPDYLVVMSGNEKKMKKLVEKEDSMPGYYRLGSYMEVLVAMDMQPMLFENNSFGEWCSMFVDMYSKTKKRTNTKKKSNKSTLLN